MTQGCRGKLLDCSDRGSSGIMVWTKRQSSLTGGDAVKDGLKGNRCSGDGAAPAWENLLDLSHNVYLMSCHSYHLH